ncbi:VOC family protein [Tessaracoccus rhinocerotis]|uniref:VOC family protein n=1 Tax=Tessaracoccus rhinocerotis TaxID=1689449 RepID=A0A553K5A8_9ACTN|nr:VOC family protein [Tessaracoccus rhinocerotis]TRY19871.1 VOC family protein [Tessaracoccus rhinocerotis]
MNTGTQHSAGRLAAGTTMDRLELRVRDMETMVRYYTEGVGLVPLRTEPGAAVLGLGGTEVLRLSEAKDLRPGRSGDAGLFHTAVLFDSAAALARSMESMLTKVPQTYTGAGDHLVSRAFYFTDPEGNGVELYHDRPRDEWRWDNGQVQMATLWLDPVDFVRTNYADGDLSGVLGHVHLQVGDVASARDFYVDTLGFDATAEFGSSALFVSAGGYHHHMAMNVWNSAGAGPRLNTLGMGVVDIIVPTEDELLAARDRLEARGVDSTLDGGSLTVLDPWRNELRLRVG